MKIAVPWPARIDSQIRIRESLALWEDRSIALICLVEPSIDPFLSGFQTTILSRNSTDLGTEVPKCYIYDMLKVTREMFPNEDWYGFGNSDCVPMGDVTEGYTDREALVYHRTDIPEWSNRFNRLEQKLVPKELADEIWQMKQQGMNDRKIARTLNRSMIPPPPGSSEWTQGNIRQLFFDQGYVFFWGQDVYLFRADVIDNVLEGYLKEKDYVLGTGAFDPRLTRYLIDNFRSARVINKFFHKIHHSEWRIDAPDYIHNGGDVDISERWEHKETEFMTLLCEKGQRTSIPKFIKYLVKKDNPELAETLLLTE